MSRQSSTTSTSTSSGNVAEQLEKRSGSTSTSGSVYDDSMETLDPRQQFDLSDHALMDGIFRRVLEWNNAHAAMGLGRGGPGPTPPAGLPFPQVPPGVYPQGAYPPAGGDVPPPPPPPHLRAHPLPPPFPPGPGAAGVNPYTRPVPAAGRRVADKHKDKTLSPSSDITDVKKRRDLILPDEDDDFSFTRPLGSKEGGGSPLGPHRAKAESSPTTSSFASKCTSLDSMASSMSSASPHQDLSWREHFSHGWRDPRASAWRQPSQARWGDPYLAPWRQVDPGQQVWREQQEAAGYHLSPHTLNRGPSEESMNSFGLASPPDSFVPAPYRPAPLRQNTAEMMLMNLGFGGSVEGFLPERFLRDWYSKLSRSQNPVPVSQPNPQEKDASPPYDNPADLRSAHDPKVPLTSKPSYEDLRSASDLHRRITQPLTRAATISSSQSHDAPDVPVLLPPSGEFRSDRLKEYVKSYAQNISNAANTKEHRRQQFAISRQTSLPTYLETLTEEEEAKSRSTKQTPQHGEGRQNVLLREDSFSGKSDTQCASSGGTGNSTSQFGSESDSLSGSDYLDFDQRKRQRLFTLREVPFLATSQPAPASPSVLTVSGHKSLENEKMKLGLTVEAGPAPGTPKRGHKHGPRSRHNSPKHKEERQQQRSRSTDQDTQQETQNSGSVRPKSPFKELRSKSPSQKPRSSHHRSKSPRHHKSRSPKKDLLVGSSNDTVLKAKGPASSFEDSSSSSSPHRKKSASLTESNKVLVTQSPLGSPVRNPLAAESPKGRNLRTQISDQSDAAEAVSASVPQQGDGNRNPSHNQRREAHETTDKADPLVSTESLEVADIFQGSTSPTSNRINDHDGGGDKTMAGTGGRGQLEPAMISIVLEDVDGDVAESRLSGDVVSNPRHQLHPQQSEESGHQEELLHIPPCSSSLSLSPIPQSPVTVIEVSLDNQQDSIDTEEGTSSSRDINDGENSGVDSDLVQTVSDLLSEDTDPSEFPLFVAVDHRGRVFAPSSVNTETEEGNETAVRTTSDASVEADDGRVSPVLLFSASSTPPTTLSSPSMAAQSPKLSDIGLQSDDGRLTPLVFFRQEEMLSALLQNHSPEFCLVCDQGVQCDEDPAPQQGWPENVQPADDIPVLWTAHKVTQTAHMVRFEMSSQTEASATPSTYSLLHTDFLVYGANEKTVADTMVSDPHKEFCVHSHLQDASALPQRRQSACLLSRLGSHSPGNSSNTCSTPSSDTQLSSAICRTPFDKQFSSNISKSPSFETQFWEYMGMEEPAGLKQMKRVAATKENRPQSLSSPSSMAAQKMDASHSGHLYSSWTNPPKLTQPFHQQTAEYQTSSPRMAPDAAKHTEKLESSSPASIRCGQKCLPTILSPGKAPPEQRAWSSSVSTEDKSVNTRVSPTTDEQTTETVLPVISQSLCFYLKPFPLDGSLLERRRDNGQLESSFVHVSVLSFKVEDYRVPESYTQSDAMLDQNCGRNSRGDSATSGSMQSHQREEQSTNKSRQQFAPVSLTEENPGCVHSVHTAAPRHGNCAMKCVEREVCDHPVDTKGLCASFEHRHGHDEPDMNTAQTESLTPHLKRESGHLSSSDALAGGAISTTDDFRNETFRSMQEARDLVMDKFLLRGFGNLDTDSKHSSIQTVSGAIHPDRTEDTDSKHSSIQSVSGAIHPDRREDTDSKHSSIQTVSGAIHPDRREDTDSKHSSIQTVSGAIHPDRTEDTDSKHSSIQSVSGAIHPDRREDTDSKHSSIQTVSGARHPDRREDTDSKHSSIQTVSGAIHPDRREDTDSKHSSIQTVSGAIHPDRREDKCLSVEQTVTAFPQSAGVETGAGGSAPVSERSGGCYTSYESVDNQSNENCCHGDSLERKSDLHNAQDTEKAEEKCVSVSDLSLSGKRPFSSALHRDSAKAPSALPSNCRESKSDNKNAVRKCTHHPTDAESGAVLKDNDSREAETGEDVTDRELHARIECFVETFTRSVIESACHDLQRKYTEIREHLQESVQTELELTKEFFSGKEPENDFEATPNMDRPIAASFQTSTSTNSEENTGQFSSEMLFTYDREGQDTGAACGSEDVSKDAEPMTFELTDNLQDASHDFQDSVSDSSAELSAIFSQSPDVICGSTFTDEQKELGQSHFVTDQKEELVETVTAGVVEPGEDTVSLPEKCLRAMSPGPAEFQVTQDLPLCPKGNMPTEGLSSLLVNFSENSDYRLDCADDDTGIRCSDSMQSDVTKYTSDVSHTHGGTARDSARCNNTQPEPKVLSLILDESTEEILVDNASTSDSTFFTDSTCKLEEQLAERQSVRGLRHHGIEEETGYRYTTELGKLHDNLHGREKETVYVTELGKLHDNLHGIEEETRYRYTTELRKLHDNLHGREEETRYTTELGKLHDNLHGREEETRYTTELGKLHDNLHGREEETRYTTEMGKLHDNLHGREEETRYTTEMGKLHDNLHGREEETRYTTEMGKLHDNLHARVENTNVSNMSANNSESLLVHACDRYETQNADSCRFRADNAALFDLQQPGGYLSDISEDDVAGAMVSKVCVSTGGSYSNGSMRNAEITEIRNSTSSSLESEAKGTEYGVEVSLQPTPLQWVRCGEVTPQGSVGGVEVSLQPASLQWVRCGEVTPPDGSEGSVEVSLQPAPLQWVRCGEVTPPEGSVEDSLQPAPLQWVRCGEVTPPEESVGNESKFAFTKSSLGVPDHRESSEACTTESAELKTCSTVHPAASHVTSENRRATLPLQSALNVSMSPQNQSPVTSSSASPQNQSPVTSSSASPRSQSPVADSVSPQSQSPVADSSVSPQSHSPVADSVSPQSQSPVADSSVSPQSQSPVADSSVSPQSHSPVADSVSPQSQSPVADSSVSPQSQSHVADSVSPQSQSPVADSVSPQSQSPVADSSVSPQSQSHVADSVSPQSQSPVADSVSPQSQSPVADSVSPQSQSPLARVAPKSQSPIADSSVSPRSQSPVARMSPQYQLPVADSGVSRQSLSPTADSGVSLQSQSPTADRRVSLQSLSPTADRRVSLQSQSPTADSGMSLQSLSPTADRRVSLQSLSPTADTSMSLDSQSPTVRMPPQSPSPTADSRVSLQSLSPSADTSMSLDSQSPAVRMPPQSLSPIADSGMSLQSLSPSADTSMSLDSQSPAVRMPPQSLSPIADCSMSPLHCPAFVQFSPPKPGDDSPQSSSSPSPVALHGHTSPGLSVTIPSAKGSDFSFNGSSDGSSHVEMISRYQSPVFEKQPPEDWLQEPGDGLSSQPPESGGVGTPECPSHFSPTSHTPGVSPVTGQTASVSAVMVTSPSFIPVPTQTQSTHQASPSSPRQSSPRLQRCVAVARFDMSSDHETLAPLPAGRRPPSSSDEEPEPLRVSLSRTFFESSAKQSPGPRWSERNTGPMSCGSPTAGTLSSPSGASPTSDRPLSNRNVSPASPTSDRPLSNRNVSPASLTSDRPLSNRNVSPASPTSDRPLSNRNVSPASLTSDSPLSNRNVSPASLTSDSPLSNRNVSPASPTSDRPLSNRNVSPASLTSDRPLSNRNVSPASPTSDSPLSNRNVSPASLTSDSPLSNRNVSPASLTSDSPLSDRNVSDASPTSHSPLSNRNVSDVAPGGSERRERQVQNVETHGTPIRGGTPDMTTRHMSCETVSPNADSIHTEISVSLGALPKERDRDIDNESTTMEFHNTSPASHSVLDVSCEPQPAKSSLNALHLRRSRLQKVEKQVRDSSSSDNSAGHGASRCRRMFQSSESWSVSSSDAGHVHRADHGVFVKPQTAATCNRPQTAATSNRPQTAAACNKPQTAATCNKPQTAATCNKPQTAATCIKPQTSATCNKPQIASTCNKPQTASTCNKPQTASTCNKPQTAAACNGDAASMATGQPTDRASALSRHRTDQRGHNVPDKKISPDFVSRQVVRTATNGLKKKSHLGSVRALARQFEKLGGK